MKKILTLLLSLTLVVSMFAACGKKNDADDTKDNVSTPAPTTAAGADVTEGAAKTGLAVINSVAKSASAGDKDGVAEISSTVVAVLVGEDGKIIDAKIDAAQTKINFSKEGKLITDLATAFKSKQELGAEYGMVKNSGIGKEWFEQANALAAYVKGKTVEEVKGIAVNETGAPADADLAASVTIKIGDYIAAIEKAVANAQVLGASSADKLGLAITTDIAKSTDVTADKEGLAQAYSFYAATTTSADGKITSCLLDSSQAGVNFDATGTITTDLTVAPQTKQEIKEGYGMGKVSGIGKEWYQQANAFAAYATGKTVDEVKGIALTETGAPSDADLAASVTVKVGSFLTVIEKAVANAK